MKRTTYRMQLSDGHRVQSEASSAAEAIEEVLWKNRGVTVIECHSGLTETEAHNMRLIDSTCKAIAGYIAHDVPRHDPVPQDAVKPKRMRLIDATEAMFSEVEMSGGRLST
jgi:hypothetical protein